MSQFSVDELERLLRINARMAVENYKRYQAFLPALNLNIIQFQFAECFDKGACQTSIGNQRNVMIDRTATDTITVRQFTSRVCTRLTLYWV